MRLKRVSSHRGGHRRFHLKRKVSQVWDWNTGDAVALDIPADLQAWKEKYLKYEIETLPLDRHRLPVYHQLEKKSISSMRLKRRACWQTAFKVCFLKRKVSQVWDWNVACGKLDYTRWRRAWKEKYLKYEIETKYDETIAEYLKALKRKVSQVWDWNAYQLKRNSHLFMNLKRKVSQVWDWNSVLQSVPLRLWCAWKEKNLKYEIETIPFILSTRYFT